MNLKLVVASMSVLGLVSCPVLASAHTKHKHHHKHHEVQTVSKDYKDYKDMAPACVVSQNMVTFVEMSQSVGRSMPNPCNPGWWNRVSVSGGINIDIGKFGNRNQNYMGENYQRLSLNDAYLNVMADVSEWSKGFASISYNTATVNANSLAGITSLHGNAEYSAAYSNNIGGSSNSAVQLEQAYMFLGNLDMSPVFLQIGKSFQDFSRYEIHPITRSMTQVMSETLATSLKLGFIANGFNGDIFVFDDAMSKIGSNSQKTTNYGLALGYDMPNDQLGWDIGAAYLYNMIGANDVAYSVANFTGTSQYNNRVGALALYGDVNSGPFSVNARYTSALQRFNVLDMTKNGSADLVGGTLGSGTAITAANTAGATGAKPWAAGITGAYGFDAWGKNQSVYVGYQTSREAAGMNIPKSRWLVGYGLEWAKNTSFGLEWDRDVAYSTGNGGTGNNGNLVSLRSSVKFG